MSFGWSAGDVAAAVNLLVNVANALNDIDGAKSHYQKDASYLHELANVLDRLKDIKTDDGEKSHIGALRDGIIQFQQRLRDDFEKRLGKHPLSGWWENLAQIPRKIQYGLFVHKEVDELRRQIDVPLKSVIISLGIQSLEISREIQQAGQSQKSILKDLASRLADLHLEVGNSWKAPEHVQTTKLFAQITNWLKPLAFDDVYERFLSTLVPGSCEWMLQLDQFQDWIAAPKIDEHYPLLWIAGAAGSGKTRLATKVIQTLRSKKRTAFFYCDAQDANKRSANSILSNWCWQLLSQDQSRLLEVNHIKSKHQIMSQGALRETLNVLLQGSTDAVLVIDAFDELEAEEQIEIYRILSGILELGRLLVFSRPLEDSFMKLKKAASKYVTLFEISESDTSADINRCIENEVAKLDIDDDAIAAKIVSTLQSSAKGMFLWAALMLDELRKPRIDELEYLTILKHLPKDLNDLYSRILEKLSHSLPAKPLTKKILEWVLFARRPLSLQEVGAAVMASSSEQRLKQAPISNERVRKTIVQHCGPLVTIHQSNDGDRTVTLVHYSLKEYFLSQKTHDGNEVIFQSNSLHAHATLGKVCLEYLCFENIDPPPYGNDTQPGDVSSQEIYRNFEAYLTRYPLIKYASLHWSSHVTQSSFDSTVCGAVCGALQNFCVSSKWTIRWLRIISCFYQDTDISLVTKHFDEITAIGGHLPPSDQIFANWLKPFGRPKDFIYSINKWIKFVLNLRFLPELHVAAFFDYHEMAQQYLESGVDVNRRAVLRQETSLCFAAMGCSYTTMRLLISRGADLNASDRYDDRPLNSGLGNCHWRTREPVPYTSHHILLDAGADPSYARPLSLLAEVCPPGDSSGLRLATKMLKKGAAATINEGHLVTTPLQWSVRWRNAELTRLLLDHGANVNANGPQNQTALLQACFVTTPNAVEIAKILLDANASASAICDDGRSALHLAVKNTNSLVALLLRAGSPVNIQADDGCTPLHDAVAEGNQDIIKTLIAHGASLETQDAEQKTPLDRAIQYQQTPTIQLLEKLGAPFNDSPALDHGRQIHKCAARDIFDVYFILGHCGKRGLPCHIIRDIMDQAKYWLVTRDYREDHIAVAEEHCQRDAPYLVSQPVRGSVKEVKIVIWSHDQGFSSYPESHGTFENSWTWFKLGVGRPSGKVDILIDPLVHNVHASFQFRRYRFLYSCANLSQRPDWIDGLKNGDKLLIIPKARFPGWKNFVREASIEIRTSCLLP